MLLGAEFFVPASCAVLSVLLMYLLLIRRVGRFMALLFSAMWAFFPIVMWGAGSLMSDLPAALALMACYYLLETKRPAAAGALLATGAMIRPTDLLIGCVLLAWIWRERATRLRFCLAAAFPGGVYVSSLYGTRRHGPWCGIC